MHYLGLNLDVNSTVSSSSLSPLLRNVCIVETFLEAPSNFCVAARMPDVSSVKSPWV